MVELDSALRCTGRCGVVSFSPRGLVGVASFQPPARALFVLPTGGGKTVVLSHLIRALLSDASSYAAGVRVLFVVHRKELVEQATVALQTCGLQPGIIMASTKAHPAARLQVASLQTLCRRLTKHDTGDFTHIFVDEAHHVAAASYQMVLDAWSRASVVGVTATPFRLDKQPLAPFTRAVYGPTAQDLIDGGFLVRPRLLSVRSTVDTQGLNPKNKDADFELEELGRRAMVISGDVVRQYKKDGAGRRAIAFCVNVKHSKSLAAAFVASGVAAEHFDASTHKREREVILARVRTGETTVLCNVELVGEGLDVPAISAGACRCASRERELNSLPSLSYSRLTHALTVLLVRPMMCERPCSAHPRPNPELTRS